MFVHQSLWTKEGAPLTSLYGNFKYLGMVNARPPDGHNNLVIVGHLTCQERYVL